MEKLIVCFPGQGSQKPKMAMDLYNHSDSVKRLFEKASDLTHLDLKKILQEADSKELCQTVIAQSTIILAEMSALKCLKEMDFDVHATAGFSLGELAAYHTAGVLSEDDLFKLIKIRGSLMDAAANEKQESPLSMAAVVGMNRVMVDSILNSCGFKNVYVANDNSSKQVVISGYESEIDELTSNLKDGGARRVIKLKVQSAFHSPFMRSAEVEFAKVLESYKFSSPNIPLYCNASGKVETDGDVIKSLASKQITHPVNWLAIMNDIKERYDGIKIVEAGPGKVLSGLFKTENMVCSPCGTIEEILELRK